MSAIRAGRWVLGLGAVGLCSLAFLRVSTAQPVGPDAFCDVYVDAPACQAGEVSCATCHVAPPELNVYGFDIQDALPSDLERPLHEDVFSAELGDALAAVEDLDSDLDSFTNIEEIRAGSSPSDPSSTPEPSDCVDLNPKDGYDVCGRDLGYVYKKVWLDFCGQSPSLLDRKEFERSKDKNGAIHEQMDACLDSEFWRGIKGRVWNLANAKIGPQQAVKTGKNSGPIPLADYDDDFAYWVWTQTDDRDVRLVLTGKDFVRAAYEDGHTVYSEWARSPDADLDARGYDTYQAVRRNKRAGLLTHRWFLMSNTMFTAIPRTTAAQAYRAFLGYDIARLEGLEPVANEPEDYDSKGVAAQGCANCHSTLDPLTYPFSRYEGIGGGNRNYEPYSYNANRLEGFTWVDGPRVAETPEAGVIFGETVEDLVEWADVAANSEAFRRSRVMDYWELIFHEKPRANEQSDFAGLVEDLGTVHEYQIERMLHALIDTEAYGAP